MMRSVVAYNKYHAQKLIKHDNRWFKSWQDVPMHEHQPLSIRKPDSQDDLLSYVSAWKRSEAVTAYNGTGTYKGAVICSG